MTGVGRRWAAVWLSAAVILILAAIAIFRPRVVEIQNKSALAVTEITVVAFGRKNSLSGLRPGASVRWSFMGRSDQGLFVARNSAVSGMKFDAMSDVVDPGARYLRVEFLPQDQLSWKSGK